MRLIIYPSKVYSALLAVFACGFAVVFWVMPGGLPALPKLIVTGLGLLILIGATKSFLSKKPILTADESGIHDTRLGRQVIAWDTILAFRHAPRIEAPVRGARRFSFSEAWRPVQLWVDAPEKTFFTTLHRMNRAPIHPDYPDSLYLELEFSGLDTPSSKMVDFIRRFAPRAKEEQS